LYEGAALPTLITILASKWGNKPQPLCLRCNTYNFLIVRTLAPI
jgi:hypothetical protein